MGTDTPRPKTLFIDIDGTIVRHHGGGVSTMVAANERELLAGVVAKFNEWNTKGYYIIVTTARRESLRRWTEEQLLACGLSYDQLVMGISSGQRVLINDVVDINQEPMAIAINVPRNGGLTHLDI